MKWLQWAGLPVGIGVLLLLTLHHGFGDTMRVIRQAGFVLLWLVPLHALPLLLDAHAWRLLLSRRAPLWFLWWVATVREAVSRLMPVASIGGEIVGIRLARWRVPDTCGVSASVIVEVLVTMAVQYAFCALGIVLIVVSAQQTDALRSIGVAFVLSIPIPVMAIVVARRGGIFHAIERWAAGFLGDAHPLLRGIDGRQLDHEIDALMSRGGLLLRSFLWQFAGYALGSFETYLALRMLNRPVSLSGALAIEAITQTVRHAAFFIPAGLGVQDAAVVLMAQMFGVDRDAALSLALVKRRREVVFGCMALASWQLAEIARERVFRAQLIRHDRGRVGRASNDACR